MHLEEPELAPPAQLNNPVGPPPPQPDLPSDYEGYVELAKKVSRGAMTEKAQLWATLALAEAVKSIRGDEADLLLEEIEALVRPVAVDGNPDDAIHICCAIFKLIRGE